MPRYREPDVTPDLVDLVRNPDLDFVRVESDPDSCSGSVYPPALLRGESTFVRRPMRPIPCIVDYDTPIVEQFRALGKDGLINLQYMDMKVLEELAPPMTGKTEPILSQHCFHLGQIVEVLQNMHPALADVYAYAAYLRYNTRVGLAYDFWQLLPFGDRPSVLHIRPYKRARCLYSSFGKSRLSKDAYVLVVGE